MMPVVDAHSSSSQSAGGKVMPVVVDVHSSSSQSAGGKVMPVVDVHSPISMRAKTSVGGAKYIFSDDDFPKMAEFVWSGRACCTCRTVWSGSSLHLSADAVKRGEDAPDGLEAIQYAMLLAMVFGLME